MRKLLKMNAISVVTSGMLVFLFVLIFGQILLRTIGHPLHWVEEVSGIAFIWLIFSGAAVAYQRRDHLDVNLLYLWAAKRFDSRVMTFWNVLISFMQLVFLVVFAIGLVMMAVQTWSAFMAGLTGFRYGWLYLGVVVPVILCTVIVAIQIVRKSPTDTEGDDRS